MVTLSLDYLQSNDSKVLLLTDTVGEYDSVTNTDGWGTPNEEVSDIVAIISSTTDKYHLTFDIVYTDSSNVETTYDTIDVYNTFVSEFIKDYGMEYELNMSHLKVSEIAIGTSDDVFPDGKYDITYKIEEADTSTEVYSQNDIVFLSGVVRSLVYSDIYQVPDIYKQKDFNRDERDWSSLLNSLFSYSYYNSLVINNNDSEIDHKLEMLYFLEQRLNN